MKNCVAIAVLAGTVTIHAAPPSNDNFENASVIAGATGSTNGTTVEATRQSGEPLHFRADDAGNSIWYAWTVPSDGGYGLDTLGSELGNDIAVYCGTSISNLHQLGAGGFDSLAGSYVHLQLQKDSNYFIAVVGAGMGVSGSTTLNYYQDNLSDWINVTTTSHTPAVAVVPDGGMVWDDLRVIVALQYRTNQYGFKALLQATTNVLHCMSYADKNDSYWFTGFVLPDLPLNAVPTDFRYKRLLLQRGKTNGFDVFTLNKKGFEKTGTVCLSNSTVEFPAALLTKKGVAIVTDGNYFGIHVYDKALANELWTIPAEQYNFHPVKSRQGGFIGLYSGNYEDTIWTEQESSTNIVLSLYKKGKVIVSHSLPQPADGELNYAADAKGSIIYWTTSNTTQGPVTCLDKKGKVVVDHVTLPAMSAEWEAMGFDGKNLIVSVDDGTTNQLVSFSIGSTVAKQGEQGVYGLRDFFWDGKAIYAVTSHKVKAFSYSGLLQFDASLATVKWTNAPASGGLCYVGRGVWCRIHASSTPPLLDLTIDVFDAKGPIVTHTIHTYGGVE